MLTRGEEGDKLPEPLQVPSLSKKAAPRRVSGKSIPRKTSGPLTPSRRVSSNGTAASLVSQVTGTTVTDDVPVLETVLADHSDAQSAVEAARHKLS